MAEYFLILIGTVFVNNIVIVKIPGLLIALKNWLNLRAEPRARATATAVSSQAV